MPIQTVRNILVAASGVTALVGQRISPVMRAQEETLPCVVLSLVAAAPTNILKGVPTLDSNRVQVDCFGSTYASARAVADACRAALEAADVVMDSEFESFEPDVDEYRVTQDWLVWT